MIAFAEIEWQWGPPLLNETARDLVNLFGFGLTFVGLALAWFQIRKTRSAAKAAEAAATNTLEENRFAFHKFAVALAHRFIHEAKIHIDNEAWEKAVMRLSDLTDQVSQLASLDEAWKPVREELYLWTATCNKQLKRFPKKKWLEFCSRLETRLSRTLGPFGDSAEGQQNDNR